MRYMLTDELWSLMGPLVERAKKYKSGQPPVLSERMFFEALLYWARTGIPWRDLPAEFGAWDAVYNRFRRWVHCPLRVAHRRSGSGRGPAGADRLDHCPGAPARGRIAAQEKKIGAARSACDQALGRSRGRLTSKVILTAADEDTAIAVDVVPGQTADVPLLEPMLDRTLARVGVVDELVADKGFDGDPQRFACIERDVATVIPSKVNRIEPWPFEPAVYRGRNKAEN